MRIIPTDNNTGPEIAQDEGYLDSLCKSLFGCYRSEIYIQKQISKNIDKQLRTENTRKFVRKLLLLGPGESGKSTFVKQMQIIHLNGFSQEMIEGRKFFAYATTKRSMMDIINAMPKLGLKLVNRSFEHDADVLTHDIEEGNEYKELTPRVAEAIKKLWTDPAVQEAYTRKDEYQLADSAKYFIENIDRISAPDYVPTNQDILQIRVPTTGVVTINFELKGIDFHVFDAGGQRAQRRKWIHFFDNVNAVIFVAAISEYNQTIREDNETNRLIEALKLFEWIACHKCFVEVAMILFLNKKDLFEEKIKTVPLNNLFPNYGGGANYENGVNYIRRQFKKLYPNKRKLYRFETCATDTNQVEQIFDSVFHMIMTVNLKQTALK